MFYRSVIVLFFVVMASVAMSMTFAVAAMALTMTFAVTTVALTMTFAVMMMVTIATIMAAGAVTIDDCSAEILLYDLLNGKFRRATMYLDAKLIEQFYSTATQTATDDVCAVVLGHEARHGTMRMLRGCENFCIDNFSGYDSEDCYLGSSTEMREENTISCRDSDFLIQYFKFHFL